MSQNLRQLLPTTKPKRQLSQNLHQFELNAWDGQLPELPYEAPRAHDHLTGLCFPRWCVDCGKKDGSILREHNHTHELYSCVCLCYDSAMNEAVMTYERAVEQAGSRSALGAKIDNGELFRIGRGIYSTTEHPDPLVVAHVSYPNSVITMDSALFLYGLTDVPPEEVHLATARDATRIACSGYRQYFTERYLLDPGAVEMERDQGLIRVYNRERLLVEVMRRQASLPLDYYKEVIGSYRRMAEDLDIRLVEDYISLFKRQDAMFDILQREVL